MAHVNDTSRDVAPNLTWWRFIGAGVAVFSGFVGFLNLASIVGRYGVELPADITALVATYKQTFYPVYDQLLRPLFDLVKVDLTPAVKDVFTLFMLAFSAANAESFIRDQRMLGWNIVMAVAQAVDFDDGRGPSTMFSTNFIGIVGLIAVLLASALDLSLGGYLLIVGTKKVLGFGFWDLPDWLRWWTYIGAVATPIFGGVYYLRTLRLSASMRGRDLEPSKGFVRRSHIFKFLFLWLNLILTWASLPVVLAAWVVLVAGGLAALIFCMVLIFLAAPVVAWRTASVTIVLFGLLISANWLAIQYGF